MKDYRANVTEEQRKRNNEKAKERMRRMRERKKEGAGVSKPKPTVTRSAGEKARKLREYKTAKQREYRAKMSASKKRAIRAKDAAYHADKYKKNKAEKEAKANKKTRNKKTVYTPQTKAAKIEELIESATPKTSKELHARHIHKMTTRRSVLDSFKAVTQSAKKVVLSVLRQTPPVNKAGLASALGIRRGTLSYKPKGRGNVNRKIWDQEKKIIQDFFKKPEISTLLPNKNKRKTDEPYHVLQVSLIQVYKEFKLAHPNINIGVFSFLKCRPKGVSLLKNMKWLQCVCDICANIKYICVAIHASMVKHNFEVPEWLPVHNPLNVGLHTLCSGAERYSASCLERDCSDCGVESLMDDLELWLGDNIRETLTWKEWRKSPTTIKGKVIHRMKLEVRTGSRHDICRSLQQKLKDFGSHSFFARWQQVQHTKCLQQLSEDEVITVVDFSENFTCTQQDEAQSAYYSHTQVTIHPCVCHYIVNEDVVRDSVVFVSDDLKHDASAVKVFLSELMEHLKMKVPTIKKLTIWSDGCASQYKSKLPFANIAKRFGHADIDIEWHYFGSRHGKNQSDGESGVIKSKMSRLMIANKVYVDSAKDFAKAAAQNLSNIDGKSQRHIYFVPSERIHSTRMTTDNSLKIKGSRKIHSISSPVVGSLKHKSASCFCPHCRVYSSCPFGVDNYTEHIVSSGLFCSARMFAYFSVVVAAYIGLKLLD